MWTFDKNNACPQIYGSAKVNFSMVALSKLRIMQHSELVTEFYKVTVFTQIPTISIQSVVLKVLMWTLGI